MKKSPLPLQNVAKMEKQSYGKERLEKLLKQHFGYSQFRGKQLEAIEAILSGNDCFCLMPTGGGKSMCYQIPALVKKGIVLVVCPLIALMENQVTALKEKGIAAEYLSSTQMSKVREKIHEDLDSGKPSLRLLYVTPELIATNGFMSKLIKLYTRSLLNLIAIDEAHCISSWGHDFRPSYRKLSSLRNRLPGVPILALTATAVPKVQKDVIESLCLQHPLVLRSSFNRPNIYYEGKELNRSPRSISELYWECIQLTFGSILYLAYTFHAYSTCKFLVMYEFKLVRSRSFKGYSVPATFIYWINSYIYLFLYWINSYIYLDLSDYSVNTVRYKDLLDDVYADLSKQLKSSGDVCAIVYCLERAACDDLSAHLLKNGISCAAYHAGLNSKLRSTVLDDWLSSKVQVVVATVAFGMGIDRKDVRIVCHFNIPKSMEAFYQESGRAGRDQKHSRSLLYYGMDDHRRMEFILSNSANKKVQSSSSQDGSSKKALADFHLMVEYCEESGCRRKKILKSFEEQVPASLCSKTCDACKHPNLVAKYLEELSNISSTLCKNGFSRIFISSSSGMAAEDRFTEFWNRDDEASGSEEDISDSDDAAELVKDLSRSKFSPKAGLNEKIAVLQRAEEDYYQKEVPDKQKNNLDKKTVSEALRIASKQRLLNSLKQTEQRLGNLKIDFEASAALLETECYKKYGKTGKTFYNSQMASTVRWLSTASFVDISNRLGSSATHESNTPKPNFLPTTSSPSLGNPGNHDQSPAEASKEETQGTVGSQSSIITPQIVTSSETIELPPIPSFSEFVTGKGKEDRSNTSSTSNKHLSTRLQKDTEKRMRLQ